MDSPLLNPVDDLLDSLAGNQPRNLAGSPRLNLAGNHQGSRQRNPACNQAVSLRRSPACSPLPSLVDNHQGSRRGNLAGSLPRPPAGSPRLNLQGNQLGNHQGSLAGNPQGSQRGSLPGSPQANRRGSLRVPRDSPQGSRHGSLQVSLPLDPLGGPLPLSITSTRGDFKPSTQAPFQCTRRCGCRRTPIGNFFTRAQRAVRPQIRLGLGPAAALPAVSSNTRFAWAEFPWMAKTASCSTPPTLSSH